MKIEVMTMWYNEEFLAPFFLNHYKFADKIHIFLDEDTNDKTMDVISRYNNVNVIPFKFPDMMDEQIKVNAFNQKYREIKDCDYVMLVDSDEFIFCWDVNKDVRECLKESNKQDVYFAHLWQIFKHESESGLNPDIPIYVQRQYGDKDMVTEFSHCYIKPIIVKPNLNLSWFCGNHELVLNSQMVKRSSDNVLFQGAHWKLVDVQHTIQKRIENRKKRQSQNNLRNGWTVQYHSVTEQEILNEYEKNKKSPRLFFN